MYRYAYISLLGIIAAWSQPELEFFEKEIRPVLVQSCYECHSVEAKKVKASLWLDSRTAMLEGGDTGPAIVPGDPDASLLIETVRYDNVDLEMPPKTKLPAHQIEALEKWVAMGAPWPEEEQSTDSRKEKFDLEKRKNEHWCWQSPISHPFPSVSDETWTHNPVDQFILAKLEQANLKPTAEAKKGDWLRRVTFDLTGLPPTPKEVTNFFEDETEHAYQKVVDRLLTSSRFGERWARHWMDLMRYAESYGHEFDYSIPHAWRYRDYLIRAFNNDVPYHQFVKEHVAGDLLPSPRIDADSGLNESVIATGSWLLGEATHGPTDVRADEVLRIDNQIDVFSKSFLGLTVSCARCHDHKFDAISTKDFYALAGYLQSSRRVVRNLDPHEKISQGMAKLQSLQRQASAEIDKTTISPVQTPTQSLFSFDSGLPDGWTREGQAFPSKPTAANSVSVALGSPKQPFVGGGVMHSGLFGNKLSGALRSPTFTLEEPELYLHLAAKGNVSVNIVIDGYFMSPYHNLLFKGTHLNPKALKQKNAHPEFQWYKLGKDLKKYQGHRVYLEFLDHGDGFLAIDEIAYRKSDQSHLNQLPLDGEANLALSQILTEAKAVEKALPDPVRVLAMEDGTPENDLVHIRGSHKSLGDEVARRNLTALGGEQMPQASAGSGRLQLAESLVTAEHPLTARVYVNRVWHHLFGVGIVSSVDDFGVMGEEPSHPELLDWLALDFVAQGWSTKKLIRQLVLSKTYRQSCIPNPEITEEIVAQIDPDNRLLYKARVRRLQAEAVRDNILAISGSLNQQIGGPSTPVHLTSFMEGRGKPKSGPLNGDGRRSLYLAVKRNFLPPFEAAFDRPIPFTTMGRRSLSNVPAQSLTLMNDPFVIQEAKRWAHVLLKNPEPRARIQQAFLTAFAREPQEAEYEALQQFLSTQQTNYQAGPNDERVWTDFCHLLFNKKESIYLR